MGDPSSCEEFMLELQKADLDELDAQEPWPDLFDRVGMAQGPPQTLVLPRLVARGSVALGPEGVRVMLFVRRYDVGRYNVMTVDNDTADSAELMLMEDAFTGRGADVRKRLEEAIPDDPNAVPPLVAAGLSYQPVAGGQPMLSFDAAACI